MLNNRTDRIKLIALIIFVVEVAFSVLLSNFLKLKTDFLLAIILFITFIELVYIFYVYETDKKRRQIDISRILGTEAKGAFDHAQVGIVVYEKDHTVTWVNEYLVSQGLDFVGEKISKCLPGVQGLFKGNVYNMVVEIDGHKYDLVKGEGEQVVYMKDVTELVELRENYKNEKVVLGLISLDNYEDTVQNEDEQMIAAINTNIRQRVVKWAMDHGGVIRRLRSDRFLVMINHENFEKMLATKFMILDEVKKEANNLNVAITSSMSFAYGGSLSELDETINDLLELVLSRGGDQVAVKEIGQEVTFYGTSSSANEKTSKVRARVMAQGLRGIMDDSSNVIIIPHSDCDLDSFGSALGISRIAQASGKTAYIVMNDIKIEPKTQEIYDNSIIELIKDHIFVSINEALSLLDDDTLVIVTDHHSADLTSAPQIISNAKRIVIIDHHRRKSETNIQAMMIYNEPAASSAVELVSELLQYQGKDVELTELESTIMYAGLLVDTDELKSRCSVRTFEACAFLKKENCDMAMANEWLRDSLEDFINKANISKYLDYVGNGFAVSAVPKGNDVPLSRTALAQGANYICAVKEVNAAFVIGQIDTNTCAISARSNGEVNVQIIMEKMGGGGHFNASGLQRNNTTVAELKEELLKVIEEYNQMGEANESSTIS